MEILLGLLALVAVGVVARWLLVNGLGLDLSRASNKSLTQLRREQAERERTDWAQRAWEQ